MIGRIPEAKGDEREEEPGHLTGDPGAAGILTAASPWTRPAVDERNTYEPKGPAEHFMVPLLKRQIEGALATYAIPHSSQANALDVGCGGQPFRRALERIGYTYTGIDARQNPEMPVDVVCAIDETLPPELTARAPFQFVLCTEVLEHVADWATAFKNLAELMDHGGRLLITCPHFWMLHEEPFDFWRPTLHSLTFFAERAGLRPVDLKAAGTMWDVLGTLLTLGCPVPVERRLSTRILTKVVELNRRIALGLLRRGWLQARVRLLGPVYLSNVVILERP